MDSSAISSVWHFLLYYAIPILALVIVINFLWDKYLCYQRDSSSDLPLPPGSMGYPLIGEMLHFIYDVATGRDFFRTRRKQYGSIYKTHLFGEPLVRIAGLDQVRNCLVRQHRDLHSAWPAGLVSLMGNRNVSHSNGSQHSERRKCLLKAFSPYNLRSYATILSEVLKDGLYKWTEYDRITVYKEARRLMFRCMCRVIVGIQGDEDLFNDFLIFESGFFTRMPDLGIAFLKEKIAEKPRMARERIITYIKPVVDYLLVEEDSHQSSNTVLARIMTAKQDSTHYKNLDAESKRAELNDTIIELLLNGHSTVSSAVTSLVMHLANSTNAMEKLREELDKAASAPGGEDQLTTNLDVLMHKLPFLSTVIKETMRITPPVGGLFRKSEKTLQIGGYQIPAGWQILFSILDSHEVYLNEDLSFNPERLLSGYQNKSPDNHNTLSLQKETLPGESKALTDEAKKALNPSDEKQLEEKSHLLSFGSGPRKCPGRTIAELTLRIFTVLLVSNFDWTSHSSDLRLVRFPALHPRDGLPSSFRRRKSNPLQSNHSCAEKIILDPNNNRDDCAWGVSLVSTSE